MEFDNCDAEDIVGDGVKHGVVVANDERKVVTRLELEVVGSMMLLMQMVVHE